ncbi:MAG TPA: WcaI family glycosyltransferase [Stellaceae bacterium]|nr:WcaI family glycosyltransferase [Stellaceae bacterium]
MRILIVGINFAPEITGVGRYTGEMAAWLAAEGHAVTVVATRPYYPEWRRSGGWRHWIWQSESRQGCRVIRCPLYVPRRVTGWRRVLHLGSFAASSLPALLARVALERPDLVMAVAPTLLTAPAALAAARLAGAKAWLHVQDLEIDAAAGLGVIDHAGAIGAALRLERAILRRFDRVSAISPRMLDAIAAKGVSRARLALLPNWVDFARIHPAADGDALRRDMGIPAGRPVALYAGSMGRKQGLENVVAAARLLSTAGESPLFLLAGAGPARATLERLAQGLANLRFLPLQPDDRFNQLLNLADIHLLPQQRDAVDLVMPSKLGPILAVGKPVIATVASDSQVALTVGAAGIIVPPEDPAALAAAIGALAADPARRARMGEAALRIARATLDKETILRELNERMRELIARAA